MKENGKVKVIYSWPVILLGLVIFFPVGIFLMLRRAAVDPKAGILIGKLTGLVGIAAYGFAFLGAAVSFSEGITSADITLIIFFVAVGFLVRLIGKRIRTNAEKINQYVNLIVNENVRRLDHIASVTGRKYQVVKQDILNLIRRGQLKNAFLDEGLREVVLPQQRVIVPEGTVPSFLPVEEVERAKAKEKTPRVVRCPYCGANNTIVGPAGECEYCGSAIQ